MDDAYKTSGSSPTAGESENAYTDSGSSPPTVTPVVHPFAALPLDNPFKTFADGVRGLNAVLRRFIPTAKEAVMRADFTVQDEGTIFLLTPVSDLAVDWVDSHLPQDAQHFGDSILVEHRYISDIVAGIQDDGLTVEVQS